MTFEQYKRAIFIRYELDKLIPLQRAFKDNNFPTISIGTEYVSHEGLRKTIKDYINNRVAELEKEFSEL